MKYKVAVEVKSKVFIEVEANDFKYARIKAESIVCDCDFGMAKNVDVNAIEAVDEHGNEEYF